jgi:glycosyltransferase involved in cell wall biosynthesis
VGILTLNSEQGLSACLDSLKDFAEVIVCDGNSTDRTREIAEAAGARVIRQYETDTPNTPCIKDKATVRQKNMEAATHDWYFYMDADDTLSSFSVELLPYL